MLSRTSIWLFNGSIPIVTNEDDFLARWEWQMLVSMSRIFFVINLVNGENLIRIGQSLKAL